MQKGRYQCLGGKLYQETTGDLEHMCHAFLLIES
jgi:hypothetical protein